MWLQEEDLRDAGHFRVLFQNVLFFCQRTLEHPHRNEGILSFPQERCYCMGLEPVKDLLLRLRFYMRDGDRVLLFTVLNIGEPPACNDWC